MKIIDLNLLLYATNEDFPHHNRARAWLESTLSDIEPVGFSWVVLLGFLRLSTRAGLFSRPLSVREAFDVVLAWLAQPCSTIVHPGERHGPILRDVLLPLGTAGNLVSDAHLAAIAIEHGAVLCSCDVDFSRFARLQWENPLS